LVLHNAKNTAVVVEAVAMVVRGQGDAEKKEDEQRTGDLQEKVSINGADKGNRVVSHHKNLNYVRR
jgi:hypothetical protein